MKIHEELIKLMFFKASFMLKNTREAIAVTGETKEQILHEAEELYLFTSDEDLVTEF
jgi:hypothetical protein